MNSEGTRPCIYMYPFSSKLPFHLGCRILITLSRFHVLYSRSLLVIHFVYSSAHLTPNSDVPFICLFFVCLFYKNLYNLFTNTFKCYSYILMLFSTLPINDTDVTVFVPSCSPTTQANCQLKAIQCISVSLPVK